MSDFIPEIPFSVAETSRFQSSTMEELRYYWKVKTGTLAPPRINWPTLRERLLKECGITNEFTGAKVGQFKPSLEPIFPPYNVSPNGKWGGRRHRISVARPADATKNENILSLSWNGSSPYDIRYDEVQRVPEPVYQRLRVLERPVPTSKRTQHEDGSVEISTELKTVRRYQISYIEVDPETKDRAGSLTEWYQQKGPSWMRARTPRDCQLIAQRLEMKWQDDERRPLPHEDILARLLEFFFGSADVEDATVENAA